LEGCGRIRTVLDQNVNVVVGKFVVLNDWKRRILTAYSYFSSFDRVLTYHGKGEIMTGYTPE